MTRETCWRCGTWTGHALLCFSCGATIGLGIIITSCLLVAALAVWAFGQ